MLIIIVTGDNAKKGSGAAGQKKIFANSIGYLNRPPAEMGCPSYPESARENRCSTDEFVSLTKDGQAKDTDPQRFVIKKHEVVAYSNIGRNCAKSHLVTEDKGAVKRSGKSGSVILEALTLTCAHPKDKKIGVNVTYSHRYYPEQEYVAFIEKGTSVLDSLEFTDL